MVLYETCGAQSASKILINKDANIQKCDNLVIILASNHTLPCFTIIKPVYCTQGMKLYCPSVGPYSYCAHYFKKRL